MLKSPIPPRLPRPVAAVALATLFAFLLAGRTYTRFEYVRDKVVTGILPAVDGKVRVSVDGEAAARHLHPPFALIARLQNETASRQVLAVILDGQPVCAPAVSPGEPVRVNCVFRGSFPPQPTHEITLDSAAEKAFSLHYLELSSHFGTSNTGKTAVFIVPVGASAVEGPSPLAVAAGWLIALGVFLLPWPDRLPRRVVIAHRVIITLVVLALAIAVLLPWISPYAIVMPWRVLAGLTAAVAAPGLWRGSVTAWHVVAARPQIVAPPVRRALVPVLVLIVFASVMTHRLNETYGGNYSGFLHIAGDTFDNNPLMAGRGDIRSTLRLEHGGYDGQFMYFAAFDPFLTRFRENPDKYQDVMDLVPYRFGRIGFPWLARLASFGDWRHLPATMVWLVLVAVAASSLVLVLAARDASMDPAWGLLVLVMPCFWQSMEATLPEPLAAAFLLFGYWAWTRKRWVGAGLLMAASLLVRETGIVLVAFLALETGLRGSWRKAVIVIVLALTPVVLWHVHMGLVLYPLSGSNGFFANPRVAGLPFAGVETLWRYVANGQYPKELWTMAVIFPIVLTAAWALALTMAVRRPSALTFATVVYATIALSFDYIHVWINVGNAERVSYEMFTLMALSSVQVLRASRPWRVAVTGFWVVMGVYLVAYSYDARFLRESLGLLIQ